MRIIDKKTDFYDYLQNIYRDNRIVFDRADSFILTKEIMCDYLSRYGERGWLWRERKPGNWRNNFLLLQVCNTFWLFSVRITKLSDTQFPYGVQKITDYSADLIVSWKNYDKERRKICLDIISFEYALASRLEKRSDKSLIEAIVQAVGAGNYKVRCSVNEFTIRNGDGTETVKHIPLLIASGLSGFIDPIDIYTSFEEYFSLEKQAAERTESVGITDKEKIENHGFDTRLSFRGK